MINAHWWNECTNFGDFLTPYIIKKLSGELPISNTIDKHLILSGSILSLANDNSIVIGAGFMNSSDAIKGNPEIKAVRGFESKKIINSQGFNCDVVGDPGLIIPLLYNKSKEKKFDLSIVPHYIDYDIKTDFNKINILNDVEFIIDRIIESKKIVTSSLHALIVAHAFDIPALLVKFSNKIAGDGFKYKDYFTSVGIKPYSPLDFMKGIPDNVIDLIPKYVGCFDNTKLFYTIKNEIDNFNCNI